MLEEKVKMPNFMKSTLKKSEGILKEEVFLNCLQLAGIRVKKNEKPKIDMFGICQGYRIIINPLSGKDFIDFSIENEEDVYVNYLHILEEDGKEKEKLIYSTNNIKIEMELSEGKYNFNIEPKEVKNMEEVLENFERIKDLEKIFSK